MEYFLLITLWCIKIENKITIGDIFGKLTYM